MLKIFLFKCTSRLSWHLTEGSLPFKLEMHLTGLHFAYMEKGEYQIFISISSRVRCERFISLLDDNDEMIERIRQFNNANWKNSLQLL